MRRVVLAAATAVQEVQRGENVLLSRLVVLVCFSRLHIVLEEFGMNF